MAIRFARPALAGLVTLALLGATNGASARTHHHTTRQKPASSTHEKSGKGHGTKKTKGHARGHESSKTGKTHRTGTRAAKPAERHAAAAPSGATSVPAGGMKVYCAAGKSPLMVRKATQGAGTTVTVVCR